MKKFLSLLLSLVMLLSITAGIDMTAFAEYDTIGTAKKAKFGVTYSGVIIYNQDPMDFYEFYVPESGDVSFVATLKNYDYKSYRNHVAIYDANGEKLNSYQGFTNEALGYAILSKSIYLSKGTYYLCMTIGGYEVSSEGDYTIKIDYKCNVASPSSFKVATRNTTSLKLKWNKIAGVSGYQLQRLSSGSYKTITNTTSTSRTVKSLKAGLAYKFRVRAYKKIDGKKYYSSWSYLTTPTKPSKPTIKTPSTNKKHQIIAKWKKVSSCSGYQVQYSKKSNFKNVIATKTVSGKSKTSYTGKNFTKGKKYYVRVRSYKTVNGKKYYSAWSSVKSIKCK